MRTERLGVLGGVAQGLGVSAGGQWQSPDTPVTKTESCTKRRAINFERKIFVQIVIEVGKTWRFPSPNADGVHVPIPTF